MVQKCPVVGSVLWKSLRKGLSKAERARLLRELRKVDAHLCDFGDNHLASAFVWRSSPQGWEFWNNERLAHIERLAVSK